MRTNVVIDDELMSAAMQLTGLTTKREVIDQALRILVRNYRQSAVLDLRGKLTWEGNLDAMREGRYVHDEAGNYVAAPDADGSVTTTNDDGSASVA